MSKRRLAHATLATAVIWLSIAALAFASPSVAHAADLPFNDPAVDGYLGFCNKDGQPIDHGRVGDQPFVWAALASSAAPAPYDAPGRTATLFAFQPRQGVEPLDWEGALLTASARYDNPAHPKAQATDGDDSLKSWLEAFPLAWDGLVQLRIYLGAPNQPPFSERYAATVIRVSGDEWSVVSGGTVACNVTNAISIETLLLPTTTTTPPAATSGPTSTPTSAAPGVTTDPTVVSSSVPATAPAEAGSGETASSPTSTNAPGTEGRSGAVYVAVAAAAVLVGSALGVYLIRRRRPTTS